MEQGPGQGAACAKPLMCNSLGHFGKWRGMGPGDGGAVAVRGSLLGGSPIADSLVRWGRTFMR